MNKKILIIELILIGALLFFGSSSYAAIEIVPSKDGKGTDVMTRTTASNSYLLCQGMKNSGESLEGTTVVPHLATNKDWGAVSYLSNSAYGTNTKGQNTGVKIQIDGVNYYSTNGNATGVMNWGNNPNMSMASQTAGLISTTDYDASSDKENVIELYKDKDTRYIETINSKNTVGMAMYETRGIFGSRIFDSFWGNRAVVSVRQGLFSANIVSWYENNGPLMYGASGAAREQVTFRPVIWNN